MGATALPDTTALAPTQCHTPRQASRPALSLRSSKMPRTNECSASVPPRTADDYPSSSPCLAPHWRFGKWSGELPNAAHDFPNDYEQMVLPVHDFITISFPSIQAATEAAGIVRRFSPTLDAKPGDSKKVIVLRSCPPEIRRQNNGLRSTCVFRSPPTARSSRPSPLLQVYSALHLLPSQQGRRHRALGLHSILA